MEVEHKQETRSFEDHHLVVIVYAYQLGLHNQIQNYWQGRFDLQIHIFPSFVWLKPSKDPGRDWTTRTFCFVTIYRQAVLTAGRFRTGFQEILSSRMRINFS